MFDISFPVAFVSGVISFFAPCVVSLLPAYIAYVSGVSLASLREQGGNLYQRKLLVTSLFYIVGFSVIFVLLGTTAAGIGTLLRQYQVWMQIIGGLFIILFGLQFAGLLHLAFLSRELRITLPQWTSSLGPLRSFMIGVLFALVWTPCVGVVLGSILTLAAIQGSALHGALLLFVYSLGISIPFLVVALTLIQAPRYLTVISRHVGLISRVAGIMLVIIGLLLVTDTYKYVNSWIFSIAYSLGYQIR